jgi:membrane fusion protein, multidrug efflux system
MFGRGKRLILVASLSALVWGCSEPETEQIVAEPIKAIKYQVVGQYGEAQRRTLSGHVRAQEFSQLSFQVSGQVLAVHVDVGDHVGPEEVIAELDPKPYQLRLDTVAAELSAAQSDLHEREQNYSKQQRVFKDSYISQSELDRARAEYEKAGSAVRLAQSRLELARRDLEKTRLLAPFEGTLNRRDIEPFEDVNAAVSVFEIQGTAGFEVSMLLPSRLLHAVSRGGSAEVAIPALGLSGLSGVVSEIGLRADNRGAYPVTVVLNATEAGVQAGMTAEVTIELAGSDSRILLPGSAFVVDESGGYAVFRYDADQSVVTHTPVAASLAGVNQLEVVEGLTTGDIVCIAGVEFLRDGQQVTLYQPPK